MIIVISPPNLVAKAPTGLLQLENLLPLSAIEVDGARYSETPIRLSLGSHKLRVTRFGYEDFEATVSIAWEKTTSLRVEQEAARFAIRSLEISPSTFDPEDPGYLGSCEARVLATARGVLSAVIIDSSGRRLRDLGELRLEGPSQGLRWDGRDDAGRKLPPGQYLLEVEGEGVSRTAKVSLASGLFARSSTLYSGVSGALFAPDARSLAAGKFELASGTELHLSPGGGGMSGMGTAHAGLRFGLASSSSVSELDLSYMGVLWQDDPYADSFSVTAAWKYSLSGAPLASPAAAAIYVKGTVARFYSGNPEDRISPSWDGTTRFTGLSAGLPLEYASGTVRFFASPEIEVSDYYPGWAAGGARWATPGAFAWAYLRLGCEATVGRYSLGLSSALRTSPFGGPLELAGPVPIGLEARWHAPASPFVLSLVATGEIDGLSSYYFGGGIGIGFRY
jgi:hypothetical protein